MIPLLRAKVDPAHVDYNGHMNDAAYALHFSHATDALMAAIGLDAAGRAALGQTIYTLSVLIHYLAEMREGAGLEISGRILEHDSKRLRVWMEMRAADGAAVAALSEQILLCVGQGPEGAKAAAFAPAVAAKITDAAAIGADQPFPGRAGRGISLRRD